MPFAANSSPKTSSSCVKNLEGSERSQSTISRKIELEKVNQFFIDWFKAFFRKNFHFKFKLSINQRLLAITAEQL